MKSPHFPLFTPFKPSPSIVTMFHILFVFLMVVIGGVLLAVGYFSGIPPLLAVIVVVLLVVIGVYLFWVGKYYRTIFFELKDDEVTWKRGVWFRQTGIVPYDRITNIDIYQGPLMRYLGFSLIKIQTAGFSGQAKAEITMEGIVEAEELRETIRTMIRETRMAGGATDGTVGAVSSGIPAPAIPGELLGELRSIRMLLEKIAEK
ncbi:membrane protein YdbS with pleckstrin-like domain [Methanolinea mesophila]|uniref:PH domain-containing protein n=1 Tax=Methanolinea mesophila TaxID=547055 RepID=UPI001AE4DE5C|nr:PH domain-containing protein [Methanolinea mesophila]MBP1929112.1 membrane protein YdbS with pleckstrin-like domain [Methanolinea mesophila]